LCDDFLARKPGDKYARDFIGMMGSEFFKRQQFEELLIKFAGFENGSLVPGAGYINLNGLNPAAMATANYMSGLALLATGNFDLAKPLLGAVVGISMEGLPLDQDALADN
jgi:hypothetical protein